MPRYQKELAGPIESVDRDGLTCRSKSDSADDVFEYLFSLRRAVLREHQHAVRSDADRADGGESITLDVIRVVRFVALIRVGDDMAAGTRALAPYTLHVQHKDHEPGDPTVWGGPVCTALGEGVADLDGLIDILGTAGFDGPVCVELASLGQDDVDELAMIERSVAWLRAHLPRR